MSQAYDPLTLARHLLTTQYPSLSTAEIDLIGEGTDNYVFRVQPPKKRISLALRMPKHQQANQALFAEITLTHHLKEHVPYAIPTIVFQGQPSLDAANPFMYSWSLWTWIDGVPATDFSPKTGNESGDHNSDDRNQANDNQANDNLANNLANDIAEFSMALWAAPIPETVRNLPSSYRVKSLLLQKDRFEASLVQLEESYDKAMLRSIFEAGLAASSTINALENPVIVHGDMLPGNLLLSRHDHRLSGVIDFGMMGIGDLAVDLLPAWTMFTPDIRAHYRAVLTRCPQFNDDLWIRGQAWATLIAVFIIPHYRGTSSDLVNVARRILDHIQDQ